MKKYIWAIIFVLTLNAGVVYPKCVNSSTYQLKGYFEDSTNIPVTGKTLSTVLFDVFYDDSTSSLGNQSTAEMGQGWYRYSYTSNGKSGIWIARDSTSTYKNFPGGILEQLCDSQLANYDSTGGVAVQDGTGTGQIDTNAGAIVSVTTTGTVTNAVTVGSINTGAITTASIVDGAITQAKEYVIAGTVNATSTTLKVYTALAITGERKYNNMCLYSASNGERSRIMSTGSGFFNVRGFSVAPADTTVLRVYADGCL